VPLPLIFGPIAKAGHKLFELVDDAWDTSGEKADRELKRLEVAARVDVLDLTIQNSELQTEALVAEAQSLAATAQAQGRSWLQRTLFPLSTYSVIGLLGWGAYAGFEVPYEALAVWLVVAGGGVIDHRLLEKLWGRRKQPPT